MKKSFQNTGKDFSGTYAAEKWCKENDISFGAMQKDEPRGLKRGDCLIAKWRNLSNEDRKSLDGVMTGVPRYGTIQVYLYDNTHLQNKTTTGG